METILIIFVMVTVISELTSILVYGKFVNDDVVDNYIKSHKKFALNPFDNSILSPEYDCGDSFEELRKIIEDHKFISKTRLTILSNYYISGVGRVPIWSKSDAKIKEMYKNLNKK
jgi:radical SAM superfamily enzyme YgiQ (UPF0313 family)